MGLGQYMSSPNQVPTLDAEAAASVTEAVVSHVNSEFTPNQVLEPDPATLAAIAERIRYWTRRELQQRGLGGVEQQAEDDLALRIQYQLLGLGFLEPLLERDDLSELMLNQDGQMWALQKGATTAVVVEDLVPGFVQPSVTEVRIVVDKLLGAVGRRINEAEPVIGAKLPRSAKLPAGARVNVVLQGIANGAYPDINIRFFEERPVQPEQLLTWGELNAGMMDFLREAVGNQARLMVAGGTATGKTTLLSCLAGLIPPELRIILVEDPAEIYLDHPHVVSLEARPPTVDGRYGVSMGDLVTTAMRMSPRWLILGEVRHGAAAVWLLRAQMSDHPGMSTIHADDPKSAVETLCLLAMIDNNPPVRYQATKTLITRALDLFVQVGVDRWGVRRILRIGQVAPDLKQGDVFIDDLWLYRPAKSEKMAPVWEQVGEMTRSRMAV